MSLCESICTFEGYINNNVKCLCEVKLKFNSFMNVNVDKYKLIYRFEVEETNSSNFWTLKCFFDHYIKAILLFNGITIFILGLIGFTIFGVILFRIIEYKEIHKNIKVLIEIALSIKAEKGELNEEEKEISDKEEEEEINDSSSEKKEEEKKYKYNKKGKNIIENNETKEMNFKEKNCDEASKKKLKEDILQIKENKIFSEEKNSIININKEKTKINFSSKGNIQNSLSVDRKSVLDKINNESINSNNEFIIDNKKKKEFLETTDYELNLLSYKEAKKEDKRTFLRYYFSLIKTKHIIFFLFKGKKHYNSRIINISYFLFFLTLCLTINAMFINESMIHHIYLSKGQFNFSYNAPKIILGAFVLYIFHILLSYLISMEDIILKLKDKDKKNFFKKMNEMINVVTLKFLLCFAICLVFLLLSWFYLACFLAIFPKTQIYLIKLTIVSFSFTLIIPLIIYLLSAFLRIRALNRNNESMGCFYKLSQYLQRL